MGKPGSEASESLVLRFSRWGLVVTAGALPLYVVRWHYGPLPTTLLETLIIATVVLYVIGRWRDGWRRPAPTPLDIPILLLLVAGAVSVLVAKDHRTALGLYRAYFVEAVAVFYVAADFLRRAETLRYVLVSLAIGSSVFSILNLAVFVRVVLAHELIVGSPPSALYGDSNYVAMYLEPMFAMAAGFVMFAGTRRTQLLGGAWFLITGSALFVMFSKGSYLAVLVLGLVAVLSVRRWRAPLLVGFAVAAILLSRLPPVIERFSTLYPAYAGRIQLFTVTLRMLREQPVLGLGLGGYSFLLNGHTPEVYPHDIWLTFWVELGALGLVSFATILIILMWRGWWAWPRVQGLHRPALWGALGALVLWTVHGLVDSPYWKNDMSVEFWVLAAMVVTILAAVGSIAPHEATGLGKSVSAGRS